MLFSAVFRLALLRIGKALFSALETIALVDDQYTISDVHQSSSCAVTAVVVRGRLSNVMT